MFLSKLLYFEVNDNKKVYYDLFLTHFFHKIQWFPNLKKKKIEPLFFEKYQHCKRHHWLNRYLLWVLSQVKRSAQPSKSVSLILPKVTDNLFLGRIVYTYCLKSLLLH
jgi:hypothetical protein